MSDVEIMKVEKVGTTMFTYSIWHGTPYRVAVFRSGKGNLLTNTAALLKANR